MCGLMFSGDATISKEVFEQAFKKIQYRGPDSSNIHHCDVGYFGFHRLSIMGLSESGMQPFIQDGYISICNGELYGFRKMKEALKQTYSFVSESDCELIIPLYLEYGVAMFSKLDAEFACVLYDPKNDCIVAARDPFGIRPMFYGYHKSSQKIMFASEAKCLVGLCDTILPFPPGYYYYNGVFTKYYDVSMASTFIDESLKVVCEEIKHRLIDGVEKRMDADAPVGYLLSGGLDSSLVCAIAAKKSDKPIRTFAVGMSEDAIDLKYAKEVSDYIGSEHSEVILTKDDVLAALPKVVQILETWDITTIRASLGMYLLCKWIKENTDIKVVFTGEISDEIFGYKYTDFAPNEIEFQKEAQKRVRELYMYDVLRADRCISSNGLEGRVPFGDLKFVDYVMGLNPNIKMNTYGVGKYLLRKAFVNDVLPEHILYRDKAAFSDAVGHSLVDYIKEYANSCYSNDTFISKCSKYTHCPPYTKESLHYRELFDLHYKEHDRLITSYWLPNQTWEGCIVDDPSARVLSNYGASGK